MTTIKNGKAAEHLVISKLLKLGFNLFVPVTEDSKIDLIYLKDGKLFKVQIKTIGENGMSVRKVKCNSKSNVKIYRYTPEDVDEFIGVDLNNQEIYFLPISYINKYQNAISLNTIKRDFKPF